MSEIGDAIIRGGPVEEPMRLRLTADEVNALRNELIRLRDAAAAVNLLHQPLQGRCSECVEYCDCPGEQTCEHGNVPWPCQTATALGHASNGPVTGVVSTVNAPTSSEAREGR